MPETVLDPNAPQVGDAIWAKTHYRKIVSVDGIDEEGYLRIHAYDRFADAIVVMRLTPKDTNRHDIEIRLVDKRPKWYCSCGQSGRRVATQQAAERAAGVHLRKVMP